MFIDTNIKLVQAQYTITTEVVEDKIVMNTKNDVFYALPEVGSLIWDFSEKPQTLIKLEEHIFNTYKSEDRESVRKDLYEFIENLVDNGLLVEDK